MILAVVQGLTRTGFDLTHQPLSFLGLGDLGWIQETNFVVSGVLVMALAWGMRSMLRPSAVGVLGPLFLVGLGVGLVIAGFFPPDPGFGYPPGTPDGPPLQLTYRSSLHGVGFMLSFGGFALACLALASRDATRGRWGSVFYTLVSAVTALTLGMWPGIEAIAVRDFTAAMLLWSWVTVQSLRLLEKS